MRLVGLLLAGILAQGEAPVPAPAPPAFGPAAGPHEVVTAPEIELRDEARAVDLPVIACHPRSGGPFPIVVFSHGAGGSGKNVLALPQFWASHGFVCLVPTHADSLVRRGPPAEGEPTDPVRRILDDATGNPDRWVQRPKDVRFLLDSLDALVAKVPGLAGLLDRERIGVAGHSLGAFTAQVVGGATTSAAPDLADPRPKAVICLSGQGPGQMGLTEGSWAACMRPMLHVTGTEDRGAGGQDPAWRKQPFLRAPAGDKYFVLIEGANHGSFTSPSGRGIAQGRVSGPDLSRPIPDLAPDERLALAAQLDNTAERLAARLGDRGSRAADRLRAFATLLRDGKVEEAEAARVRLAALRGGAEEAPAADAPAIFDHVKTVTLAFLAAYVRGDEAAKAWLASDALATAARGGLTFERR